MSKEKKPKARKKYERPVIRTEKLLEAQMATCNGSQSGPRKDGIVIPSCTTKRS